MKSIYSLLILAIFAVTTGCKTTHQPIRMMVKIPAGTFIMGGDVEGDSQSKNASLPKHEVIIDSFYMDKHVMTQRDYEKIMGTNPAKSRTIAVRERTKDREVRCWPFGASFMYGDNYPIFNISWFDAIKYCNARSKKEGLESCYDEKTGECDFRKNGYRLPTEAEWEYACRAGTNARYFFGDDTKRLIEYANYWPDEESWNEAFYKRGYYNDEGVKWDETKPLLLPIGSKKPNNWGLYEMLGYVDEWCNDWSSDNYYSKSPKKNPRGPKEGIYKVLRGRGWQDGAKFLSCADRSGHTPTESCDSGFRCVRKAEE